MTNPTEGVIDWSGFNKIMNTLLHYYLRLRSMQSGPVRTLEVPKATLLIWHITHHESFAELIHKVNVNFGENVKHDSAKLSLFVDSDNTIGLNGHLSKATLSEELKHPVPFLTKHLAAVLILRLQLENNRCEKTEHARSLVQCQFWVPGLKCPLCSIKAKSTKYRKLEVQLLHRQKADSPKGWLEGNAYLFKNTGADYFGLFEVTVLRKPVKHQCCSLTCLFTWSVHIEVVNGLNTDAWMMTNTTFTARHGKLHTIFGTMEPTSCFNAWNRYAIVADWQVSESNGNSSHLEQLTSEKWCERVVRTNKKEMKTILGIGDLSQN